MPLRVDESNPEQKVCFFTVEHGEEIRICDTLEVMTDSEKSMSFVEIEGRRVYISEKEADALTVAGAKDGRKHLKADDSDSVI
ncbi:MULTISPECIES: DUF3203 family protein [Pseudomonas]|jgi:hypothetical protein|uniref:Uncharacterized protein DUF3203 n=2 Tax=Pseudomonas TaxID=286 RepID=A0A4R7UZL2_9PSED|nr:MULTISPECIES: DUF3203 family protein [Pseudomonas]PYC25476.1 DUF3203 domain-containing protein [Pseudomonas jessenii]QKV64337.1 DUF3203 family protein [Pseudomonas sp. 43A]QMW07520.1 DUF3203 family protein [Pseudomonas sp. 29A]TDV42398.1 uncharacterized protein DUF3203 [Pseudomonas helmanticensis]VVP90166.1 hypothetical protein PS941_01604 [Pseudomonas fluorescens]